MFYAPGISSRCFSRLFMLQLLHWKKGSKCRFVLVTALLRLLLSSSLHTAAAMTEIMKTQVELALQNRHATVLAQPEAPVAPAVVVERSKAEKLQEAMEMEGRRRAQQIHDDRKRKFNSLDADAKEVTGAFLK